MSRQDEADRIDADVVVLGGGPAGCWAAWNAHVSGARVLLLEKGYVGTSGAMAAGNNTISDTRRGTPERDATVDQRVARGAGLVERDVVEDVLDRAQASLDQLSAWGYDFPVGEDGRPYRGMLRGPDCLRFMRQRLLKAGVTILDHHPAEHLLQDADGAVAGVRARSRRTGRLLDAAAGAVVIATGGCTFASGAFGTNNLTGDGYLMGVEAGATLSGMEFSGQYGLSPAFSNVTKGVVYFWATFSDEAGREITLAGDRQSVAANLLNGPVFAVIDKASPRLQEGFRVGQPNIFVPFDRMGIDPFRQRFPVTLRLEGTVRGTGGLVTDGRGATPVPGLFVAGDAATRETMSGATSGGGGPNAAWAIATGSRAGERAAAFARNLGPSAATRVARPARGTPAPTAAAGGRSDARDVVALVQAETLPLRKGFFRQEADLARTADLLGAVWRDAGWRRAGDGRGLGRVREAEALVATARWVTASALARRESRGVHRRTDLPRTDPALAGSLLSGGVDAPWARFAAPAGPHREARAAS